MFRPKYRDKRTGKVKQQKVWWVSYSVNGKKHRESSGSTVHRDAVKLLTQRLAERGRGISRRDLEKVTFSDLAAAIVVDYKKNGRRSLDRLENSLMHLGAAFSGWRVVDISEDAIDRYAVDRLQEGAQPGTVNRELAALRRAFRLGKRAKMVGIVPTIDMLAECNVREGFVEDGEFAALAAELPDYARPIAVVAFVTGWRRGELLSRRWCHIDFEAGWIRLEPGETKNRKGRMFPLIPRLRQVLEEQYERKLDVERRSERIVDAVFFYDTGEPVKDFRGSWESACIRAGHPALLFHDLRRTAVRNLVRSGVPETISMKLTGHLTRSVFERYTIVDETLLKEGAEKLTAYYGDATPDRKVLPIER